MTKISLDIPSEVSYVTTKLQDAGYESYFVGGCVRDLLLQKTPNDWDVTTNATPEQIQAIFGHTFYENDFGTVGIVNDEVVSQVTELSETINYNPYAYEEVSQETKEKLDKKAILESLKVVEVTPYRTESVYSDNRRPDSIEFAKTLAEDLKRRDFTINALAYDPVSREITDLYSGVTDLNNGVIVTVGNADTRFQEDALRMLRAIRFSSQLGFTINKEVQESIKNNQELLHKISRERIRDEFIKILNTESPMNALLLAKDLHVLDHISSHISRGIGVKQNGAHIYDVFEHNVRTMQHGADKEWPMVIRLSGLFHDISKPETRRFSKEKNDYTFYGHEVVGARVTKKVLEDLKFPTKTVEKVTTLVRWHMFFSDPDQITLSAVRRIIRNVGPDNVWDLIRLRICDRIGMGRPKEKSYRLRKYVSMMDEAMRSPISVKDLKLNGDEIMEMFDLKPGKQIGYLLKSLMNITLETPENNNKEYLVERVTEYLQLPIDELQKLAESGEEAIDAAEKEEIRKIRRKHKVQ